MNKKTVSLVMFLVLIIFVSILAYTQHIPTVIKAVPFYDSIGHYILFGILGLLAQLAFNYKSWSWYGIRIYIGPLLAGVYACIDEFLQIFSPIRTFDLADLFFGLMGITCFTMLHSFIRHK